MIVLLLLQLTAFADEPSAELTADGRVVGRMIVPAPAPDVRAAVESPIETGALSPEVMSVDLVETDDAGCEVLQTSTRGLFRPLTYRSRRCRTEGGWRDELLESEDFSAYEAEWVLEEVDGGTAVTVSIQTELNLPIPRGMIEKRQRKTVIEILDNLAAKVAPKKQR